MLLFDVFLSVFLGMLLPPSVSLCQTGWRWTTVLCCDVSDINKADFHMWEFYISKKKQWCFQMLNKTQAKAKTSNLFLFLPVTFVLVYLITVDISTGADLLCLSSLMSSYTRFIYRRRRAGLVCINISWFHKVTSQMSLNSPLRQKRDLIPQEILENMTGRFSTSLH